MTRAAVDFDLAAVSLYDFFGNSKADTGTLGFGSNEEGKDRIYLFWLYSASVVLHRNADTGTHVLGAEDNVPTRVGNSFLGIAQQVKKSLAHF